MSIDTYKLREIAVEKYFGNERNYRNLCRKYLYAEDFVCEIYLDNQFVEEYGVEIKHSMDYYDRIMCFLKNDIAERRKKHILKLLTAFTIVIFSIVYVFFKFGFANLFAVMCVCGAFGALTTTPICFCGGR